MQAPETAEEAYVPALPLTIARLRAMQVAEGDEPTAPSDEGTMDESLDENPPQAQDTQDKA